MAVLPLVPPNTWLPIPVPQPHPRPCCLSYTNTDSWLMSLNYLPLPSHYDNDPKWQGGGDSPHRRKANLN